MRTYVQVLYEQGNLPQPVYVDMDRVLHIDADAKYNIMAMYMETDRPIGSLARPRFYIVMPSGINIPEGYEYVGTGMLSEGRARHIYRQVTIL